MQKMQLTEDQQACGEWVIEQLKKELPEIVVDGCAGSGKTTIMRAIRRAIKTELDKDALVVAPTHEACKRLKSKGIADASTIHSMVACPIMHDSAQRTLEAAHDGVFPSSALSEMFTFVKQENNVSKEQFESLSAQLVTEEWSPERFFSRLGIQNTGALMMSHWGTNNRDIDPGIILLVDESSMVDEHLAYLAQSKFSQIVYFGDSRQLRPVKSSYSYFKSVKPRFNLQKSVRHADSNHLVDAALNCYNGGYISVLPESRFDLDQFRNLDAVALCYTHAMRMQLTNQIRHGFGYRSDFFSVGEKLIAKAAYGHISRGDVLEIAERVQNNEYLLTDGTLLQLEFCNGRGGTSDEALAVWSAHVSTVHSAQGKEWSTVYVTGLPRLHAEYPELAYTAITRAQKQAYFLR